MRWLLLLIIAGCAAIPAQTGPISIFFCQVDDCGQGMLDAINSSDEIRCAFYDLDYDPLERLLAEKEAELLVYEENHHGSGTPIPARHGGLMHDKFCILDRRIVMTGSANPTLNGLFKNDNNLLIIEGEAIARNYLEEFEELRGKRERRTSNKEIIHERHMTGEGFLIENYFCPEDDCEEEVLEELEKARSSIRFMTFSFTSDAIGEVLMRKAAAGVEVRGIFERRQENRYSEYARLREAAIDVRLDSNPQSMHHKAFIVDGGTPRATVILGSYNPTRNGNTRNDENILIIHDERIADEFNEEFERVREKTGGID